MISDSIKVTMNLGTYLKKLTFQGKNSENVVVNFAATKYFTIIILAFFKETYKRMRKCDQSSNSTISLRYIVTWDSDFVIDKNWDNALHLPNVLQQKINTKINP